MESDDYDSHSSHILLRHRPSGAIVGTARLILPDPLDPKKPFPTERYMTLNSDPVDIANIPRQNIGEISRLHITREFRRRKEDHERSEAGVAVEENGIKIRRRFPHPILALAVGLIRISAAKDITDWISIMDPALNRLLSAYGLQHDSIGPLTEYYGQRGPYYANLTHMLDRMNKKHKDIWELVTDYGRVVPKCQRDAIASTPHPTALVNI
jgi:N-acyl amino acid synthase of PEP-CTERM/exosortase system